jgi:hypothetical protein
MYIQAKAVVLAAKVSLRRIQNHLVHQAQGLKYWIFMCMEIPYLLHHLN